MKREGERREEEGKEKTVLYKNQITRLIYFFIVGMSNVYSQCLVLSSEGLIVSTRFIVKLRRVIRKYSTR